MVATAAEAPAGGPRGAPEPLPDGTLTLLFTDIQGSTLLLDRLGLHYREVLSRQREIMRRAIADHGGREMGTEGDSFFVVFRTAPDAVAAAVQAQEQLVSTVWPEQVDVRVRMGMHTGSPSLHEDGYVGMDVHLAARVASTATGGQVLLSDATRALLAGPDAVELRDLGLHRLKDVADPVRLHEVVLPGVPERRPSVRSLGSLADLPTVHGDLVGRDDEVEQVLQLLSPGRVVTIVGPGGVGKSRLAIEVARRREGLPDGVYFVPLAGASTEEEVWGSLAAAAGLTGAGGASREQVLGGLADRRLLLVLDNLEHLPGAGEAVRAIVRSATRAEVLVTSRSPLRLEAEQLMPLQPLDREHATQLYVDQVRRQRPGWTPGGDDLRVVGDICERLDGLPLAVELVAARSRLLTPRAMLAHLDGALDVPGRAVDRSVRQHTLRSTLDWSWRLLEPATARALARLGVFRGPFGIDAAAAVTDAPVDDAVDILLDLVDASLLQADESSGDPRFRILRVVRSYAQERLAERPEDLARARTRHAEVVATVVRHECPRLRGTHHVAALDVLEEQHGNIAHALDWCLREGSAQLATGLDLCRLLSWHWHTSWHHAEGLRWLTRACEVVGETEDPAALATWHGLGILLDQHGELDRAAEILQRCLDAAVARGDRVVQGRESNSLALVQMRRGDTARARALFTDAHRLAHEDGDEERISTSLSNLAMLELDLGEGAKALPLLEEVFAIDQRLGDVWGMAVDRLNLAQAQLAVGDLASARTTLVGRGAELLALGDAEVDAELLEQLAVLAAASGHAEVVPPLLGAAGALREAAFVPRVEAYERRLAEATREARAALGEQRWSDLLTQGSALSQQEAWRRYAELLPA